MLRLQHAVTSFDEVNKWIWISLSKLLLVDDRVGKIMQNGLFGLQKTFAKDKTYKVVSAQQSFIMKRT